MVESFIFRWKFDPDLLNFDELNLKKFYSNKGFVDANIEASQAELSHEKDLFFITINVMKVIDINLEILLQKLK